MLHVTKGFIAYKNKEEITWFINRNKTNHINQNISKGSYVKTAIPLKSLVQ